MSPESPLFGHYTEQLDAEIAAAEFNRGLNGALDILETCLDNTTDIRLMTDTRLPALAIETSTGIPHAKQIGESLHAAPGNNMGVTPDYTRASMSPPFDEFTRGGIGCATFVARLRPHQFSTPFQVYRIVLATNAQRTLPDERGVYVARSTTDQTVHMFRVYHTASDYSSNPTVGASLITDQAEREAVLSELQKGAKAARELSRRR